MERWIHRGLNCTIDGENYTVEDIAAISNITVTYLSGTVKGLTRDYVNRLIDNNVKNYDNYKNCINYINAVRNSRCPFDKVCQESCIYNTDNEEIDNLKSLISELEDDLEHHQYKIHLLEQELEDFCLNLNDILEAKNSNYKTNPMLQVQ